MSRFWYNFRVKKILAVSGGVDSMVLLDIFLRREPENIVVAHFNHGTRPSADIDEEFVRQKCEEFGIPFESSKLPLGEGVSEEEAREKRYAFLYHVANKYQGEICTAHHIDDLLESVAINLIRGTYWRGLSPFGNKNIVRPLISRGMDKTDILRYAGRNHLCFRQDPTNHEEMYLRNRVRKKLRGLEVEKKRKLWVLSERQRFLRAEIEESVKKLANDLIIEYSDDEIKFRKDFFTELENNVAEEILRVLCLKRNISLTRPQIMDFLNAIRKYQPGKKFNLPKNKMAVVGKDFIRI